MERMNDYERKALAKEVDDEYFKRPDYWEGPWNDDSVTEEDLKDLEEIYGNFHSDMTKDRRRALADSLYRSGDAGYTMPEFRAAQAATRVNNPALADDLLHIAAPTLDKKSEYMNSSIVKNLIKRYNKEH